MTYVVDIEQYIYLVPGDGDSMRTSPSRTMQRTRSPACTLSVSRTGLAFHRLIGSALTHPHSFNELVARCALDQGVRDPVD